MAAIAIILFAYCVGLINSDVFDEFAIVEDYAVPMVCNEPHCPKPVRERRSKNSVRSRVVEVMLNTTMFPLNPAEHDILSFMRDQYELPKGNFTFLYN